MAARTTTDPEKPTKKLLSAATVEDALRDAARAAFLVVGPHPALALPDDYAPRRSLFHGLRDAERRALLLALLQSEDVRLHHDAEASFQPKMRKAPAPLDRGDCTTDQPRPKLRGDVEPNGEAV